MKRTILIAATLALGIVSASAQTYHLGPLKIEQPWTRATPKGASVGGGYLKITNTGTESDRLIGGSVEPARRIEMHEMKTEQGVMRMRPLPNGLEIKPGETVEFKPGSFHLMFMDLKKPLEKGQRVSGTLQFEKAGTLNVEYPVEAIGGPPPAASAAPSGHSH